MQKKKIAKSAIFLILIVAILLSSAVVSLLFNFFMVNLHNSITIAYASPIAHLLILPAGVPLIFPIALIVFQSTSLMPPWGLAILSLGFFIFAILFCFALLFLSNFSSLSELRYPTLWISRLLGKIFSWLESGWLPVVRLADVLIIVWIIEILIYYLVGPWAFPGNRSLLNETIYNATSIEYLRSGSNLTFWAISGISAVLWLHWQRIIAVWLLSEVFIFAWRVSHQLVIEFVDYRPKPIVKSSDNEASQSIPCDLPDLLLLKLGRISELYRVVNERRAIPSESGAGRPIDATIKAEDINALLTSAVTADSKFSLGPLSIPAGSITGIIGLLFRGPRIVVSLHEKENAKNENNVKEKTSFITAHMVGGKEPYSWLVDNPEPLERDQEGMTRTIEDQVTELAHRIFANLSFKGRDHVPWKAAWYFNEGLRSYRDSLQTNTQRKLFLIKAEKSFIESLREDDDFSPTYYNLGVVYTELGHLDAAKAAFSKAIKTDVKEWRAYYALALNIFERNKYYQDLKESYQESQEPHKEFCKMHNIKSTEAKGIIKNKIISEQYKEAVRLCEHVIHLKEREANLFKKDYANLAKANNLMGNIQGELSRYVNKELYLNKALKSCEKAANNSWKALLEAEVRNDDVENTTHITSECLIDLAFFIRKKCKCKRTKDWNHAIEAENLLKQAIYINPTDANLYLELGRVYCSSEWYEHAIKNYEYALQIDPENSQFLVCLAAAASHATKKEIALLAIDNIVLFGQKAQSGALEKASKVWSKYNSNTSHGDNALHLKRAALLAELEGYLKKGKEAIPSVKMKLEQAEKEYTKGQEDIEWRFSQIVITLIHICKKLKKEDNYEYKKLCEEKYLFSWDKIPGKDNGKLIDYLVQKFNIDWARTAKIEKIENRKIIQASTEKNSLFLVLNPRKNEATLIIDDGRIGKFMTATEKDELNIYEEHNVLKAIEGLKRKLEFDSKINDLDSDLTMLQLKFDSLDAILIKLFIYSHRYASSEKCLEKLQNILALWTLYFMLYVECESIEQKQMQNKARISKVSFNKKFEEKIVENEFYLKRIYVQELSHFLIKQGCLYQDYEMHEEAISCFKRAIRLLNKDEITQYCLQSLLAKSLHEKKDEPDQSALKEAQKARVLNPLSYLEHKTLGEFYCDLEEFDYGLEELNHALSWKHDEPVILFQIGRTYLKRAKRCPEKKHKNSELKKAAIYLDNALNLYEKDEIIQRGKTRYWLGKVHLYSGEYYKAIPNFRILYNLLWDGGKGESGSWLIAALQLGRAYLHIKDYDECERLFDEIINRASKIKINKEIGGPLEDLMLGGELLAWACLGKSFSYAERNQEIGKLPDKDFTLEALNYIKQLKHSDKMKINEKDLTSRKRRLKALSITCIGRIRYKKDHIVLAIRLLSRSISQNAEALSYLYLAQAYKRQLELLKPVAKEEERSIIKRKALICCSQAIDLDFRGICAKRAERLKKEISGEEEKEAPKEEGKKGTISLEGNAKGTFSWKSPLKEEKQE